MCNLYSLNKKRDMLTRFFRVSHNRAASYEPLTAIFPGHTAPVVRASADGELELVPMSWGFVLPQAGKAARRVTNVRDDKVLESRFWRSSFEERRCLVPATSFCEPNGDVKPATWHWFATATILGRYSPFRASGVGTSDYSRKTARASTFRPTPF